MTNWTLAAMLLAGEFGFLTQTVRAFGVVSGSPGREGEARRAKAGYETAMLWQISELYEEARSIKRLGKMSDLLFRADFSDRLAALIEAGVPIRRLRQSQRSLKVAAPLLCAAMVGMHLTAPAFLLNNVVGYELISHELDEIAACVFTAFAVLTAAVAFLVWRLDIWFKRVVAGGTA